jgi:hypothetical protein
MILSPLLKYFPKKLKTYAVMVCHSVFDHSCASGGENVNTGADSNTVTPMVPASGPPSSTARGTPDNRLRITDKDTSHRGNPTKPKQ